MFLKIKDHKKHLLQHIFHNKEKKIPYLLNSRISIKINNKNITILLY